MCHKAIAEEKSFSTKDVKIIEEGEESVEFWNLIGGQFEYCTQLINTKPRLFISSNASGTFQVEELFDFCQV